MNTTTTQMTPRKLNVAALAAAIAITGLAGYAIDYDARDKVLTAQAEMAEDSSVTAIGVEKGRVVIKVAAKRTAA